MGFVLALAAVLGGPMFKWVDKQGNVHITDTLAEVPEPYYSMYEARLKEREEAKKNGKPAPSEPVAAPPRPAPEAPQRAAEAGAPTFAEKEAARRVAWKTLVAHWRGELAAATLALEEIDANLSELGMNPVLRETPAVKQRTAEVQVDRQKALLRVEQARKMLLEDLPQRARRELVPPAWLL